MGNYQTIQGWQRQRASEVFSDGMEPSRGIAFGEVAAQFCEGVTAFIDGVDGVLSMDEGVESSGEDAVSRPQIGPGQPRVIRVSFQIDQGGPEQKAGFVDSVGFAFGPERHFLAPEELLFGRFRWGWTQLKSPLMYSQPEIDLRRPKEKTTEIMSIVPDVASTRPGNRR